MKECKLCGICISEKVFESHSRDCLKKKFSRLARKDNNLPTSFCQVCKLDIGNLSEDGRNSHVNECLGRSNRNDPKNGDEFENSKDKDTCRVCKKILTVLSPSERLQHVNSCADQTADGKVLHMKRREALDLAPTVVLDCPVCGQTFKTKRGRQSHLNRCAPKHGVSSEVLKDRIAEQESEYREKVEAGYIPEDVLLNTEQGGRRRKKRGDGNRRNRTEKNSRKKKADDADKSPVGQNNEAAKQCAVHRMERKFEEDVQVALALSVSMNDHPNSCLISEVPKYQTPSKAETTRSSLNGMKVDRDAFSLLMTQKKDAAMAKRKGKRKAKVCLENLPLLIQSQQEVNSKLVDRVSGVIFSGKKEEITATPQFSSSKVGKKYKDHSNGDQEVPSFLHRTIMHDSLLSSTEDVFYVSRLMPPITKCTVAAGSKVKHLAAIPGWSSFTEPNSALKKPAPRRSSMSASHNETLGGPPCTQTAVLLAELAQEHGTTMVQGPDTTLLNRTQYREDAILLNRTQYREDAILLNRTQYKEDTTLPNRTQYKEDATLPNRTQYKEDTTLLNRTQYKEDATLLNRTQYKEDTTLLNRNQYTEEPSGFFNVDKDPVDDFPPVLKDYWSMVGNDLCSDLTIITAGQEIPAHKFVLGSRCQSLLTLEKNDRLDLSNYQEEPVLVMLRFLYTGYDVVPTDLALEVRKLASKYKLQKLIKESQKVIDDNFLEPVHEETQSSNLNPDVTLQKMLRDAWGSSSDDDTSSDSDNHSNKSKDKIEDKTTEDKELESLYTFMATQRSRAQKNDTKDIDDNEAGELVDKSHADDEIFDEELGQGGFFNSEGKKCLNATISQNSVDRLKHMSDVEVLDRIQSGSEVMFMHELSQVLLTDGEGESGSESNSSSSSLSSSSDEIDLDIDQPGEHKSKPLKSRSSSSENRTKVIQAVISDMDEDPIDNKAQRLSKSKSRSHSKENRTRVKQAMRSDFSILLSGSDECDMDVDSIDCVHQQEDSKGSSSRNGMDINWHENNKSKPDMDIKSPRSISSTSSVRNRRKLSHEDVISLVLKDSSSESDTDTAKSDVRSKGRSSRDKLVCNGYQPVPAAKTAKSDSRSRSGFVFKKTKTLRDVKKSEKSITDNVGTSASIFDELNDSSSSNPEVLSDNFDNFDCCADIKTPPNKGVKTASASFKRSQIRNSSSQDLGSEVKSQPLDNIQATDVHDSDLSPVISDKNTPKPQIIFSDGEERNFPDSNDKLTQREDSESPMLFCDSEPPQRNSSLNTESVLEGSGAELFDSFADRSSFLQHSGNSYSHSSQKCKRNSGSSDENEEEDHLNTAIDVSISLTPSPVLQLQTESTGMSDRGEVMDNSPARSEMIQYRSNESYTNSSCCQVIVDEDSSEALSFRKRKREDSDLEVVDGGRSKQQKTKEREEEEMESRRISSPGSQTSGENKPNLSRQKAGNTPGNRAKILIEDKAESRSLSESNEKSLRISSNKEDEKKCDEGELIDLTAGSGDDLQGSQNENQDVWEDFEDDGVLMDCMDDMQPFPKSSQNSQNKMSTDRRPSYQSSSDMPSSPEIQSSCLPKSVRTTPVNSPKKPYMYNPSEPSSQKEDVLKEAKEHIISDLSDEEDGIELIDPPTDMSTNISGFLDLTDDCMVQTNDLHPPNKGQFATPVGFPVKKGKQKKRKSLSEWVPPSPYTPQPEYEAMATPGLQKVRKTYGIKDMPKKKIINVLKHIYKETHDYETDPEYDEEAVKKARPEQITDESEANAKRQPKGKDTKVKQRTKKASVNSAKQKNKETTSSKEIGESSRPNKKRPNHTVSTTEDSESDQSLCSASRSFVAEESVLEADESEPKLSKRDVQFKRKQLWDLIMANDNLQLQIMHYEPIDITEFLKLIKEAKLNIGSNIVKDFLDEKSIPFSLRNQNKVSYGRKGKKKNKS